MSSMKNRNKPNKGRKFWNKEYAQKDHLALSTEPSEDLLKFIRWLEREEGHLQLNSISSAVDIGCGNGRNLIYLAQTFGMAGTGIDISAEAIAQAKANSEDLPLTYHVQSIAESIPVADNSCTIVLDMMASHVLNESERKALRNEILRVLKPGGWLFFKTFLLDEDLNAKRLLAEHPADEPGSYIHPKIGILEHVFTEAEIDEVLGEDFIVHKIYKSHRHMRKGKAFKRRSISVYAQKKF